MKSVIGGDGSTGTEASSADKFDALLVRTPIVDAYLLCMWANYYTGRSAMEAEHEFGLNRDDCNVVISLGSFGPLTATDICALNGRPKNSISRAVHRVLARGLIDREPDLLDRRKSHLLLTPEGLHVYTAMMPLFVERQEMMLGILSPDERATLRTLMRKIMRHPSDWQVPF